MDSKIIKIEKLQKEIERFGFGAKDEVVLIGEKGECIIKRIAKKEEGFKVFAKPIWKEAKKQGLKRDDIGKIIHRVRKGRK